MIMPIEEPKDAPAAPPEFPARVADFFRPGGAFEIGCSGEPFPYEHRPQQLRMADAVAAALAGGRHLAVEAGTGVGKSFAYLVPAILAAMERKQRTVVSTCTISLQEQLMAKDIPFLRTHLGADFRAVLVKGRSNYLCRRRLDRAIHGGPSLFDAGGQDWLHRIRDWAAHEAQEGALQELPFQPPPGVWDTVCAEADNCRGPKCPEYRSCFLMTARRQVATADLMVANHHLLFSDLGLRGDDAGFLPDFTAVVLDEAHTVEDVASDHFGLRLSHFAFEHLLRRLYLPETGKGLLAMLRRGAPTQTVQLLWDGVARLFDDLREAAALRPGETQRRLLKPLAIESAVPGLLKKLSAELRELQEEMEDEDLVAEVRQSARRAGAVAAELDAFLGQTLEDHVYWMELEGRRRQLVLHSAPVEVAPVLRKALFDAVPTVIMTSATLAVNESLDYFLGRVGAAGSEGISVGSPFDYVRQMRVWIPDRMPKPSEEDAYTPAAARAVVYFASHTRGSAFVLFTSSASMRKIAALVRGPLERAGLAMLVQGEGLSRHRMLEEFRKGQGAVLFGLDSFWMGVDVRGEALSNVIIMRLPFAVPDQPVVRARLDRIQQRGGDPFREYSLPEAVIKFRQGVGRLIRTATDTGVIVVLDRRIADQWYGRWFLRSLPECPVEFVEVPSVELDGEG